METDNETSGDILPKMFFLSHHESLIMFFYPGEEQFYDGYRVKMRMI